MAGTLSTTGLNRLRKMLGAERASGLEDRELLEYFLRERDENAFSALVRRHGGLVLGVCRRVLHNEHDAEDAFQATFLVLAKKARTIRKGTSVASWLYGVAYRVACKARGRAAGRNRREKVAARSIHWEASLDEMTWRELRQVLDEELAQLPDKFRGPLVLCYLQGLTQDEAAGKLGWSPRTVRARLEGARDRLRRRLTRRGLTLSATLFPVMLTQTSSAAIPPGLIGTTVQGALGQGAISSTAASLAMAFLRDTVLGKLKLASVLLFMAAVVGAGFFVGHGTPTPVDGTHNPKLESLALNQETNSPKQNSDKPNSNPAISIGSQTEDALIAGLHWMVGRQVKDGSWSFDVASVNDVAATAMALLPLLEAGHTHKAKGPFRPYARNVERGLSYLMNKQKPNGDFTQGMYAHALATFAICKAYHLTADSTLKGPAQNAVDFIVNAQHQGGGWRYAPLQAGDTSVTSWMVQALACARGAKLKVPDVTLAKVSHYLDGVSSMDGSAYGYVSNVAPSPTMSAAGVLSRLELGAKQNNKGFVGWAEGIRQNSLHAITKDLYYCYHVTRALQKGGGDQWQFWEPQIRNFLIEKQIQGEDYRGSWPSRGQIFESAGGRHLYTSLALLTLQTCAKNDPPVPVVLRALKHKEVVLLYQTLGENDMVQVRHALRALLGDPKQTVSFLKKTLQPVPSIDSKRIDRLILDLNSEKFVVRQNATKELEKFGELSHPALAKALLAGPPLEVRRRIGLILEASSSTDSSPEQRRFFRSLEILAQIGSPEARQVLQAIAKGAPQASITQAAKDALKH